LILPQIRKILYTTDLSGNARHAFAYAASLANRYDAAVTILYVLEELSPSSESLVTNVMGEARWREMRQKSEADIVAKLKERLTEFCLETQKELPACPFITERVLVKVGNPVHTILDEAEKGGYDLVVMGAHGQGLLADAFLGSTSRRVIRRCRKPVLVVRLPDEAS
jgi:nucleotide-binding universal stress UspA family protein